ncbi:hypothetical protein JHK85_001792 [Glycine max]|nr:hypothetical protein JHK85_001792 [Glycine max]KAG5089130.1 hypothetical protein JHK86_001742 [Glycine max]
MITTGFIKNPSLAAKLVLSFISSPHEPLVEFARYVFYMHHAFHDFCNDPFFWNPLIRSHSHGREPRGALVLLCLMIEYGVRLDGYSFSLVLKACAKVGLVRECGCVELARQVFDRMPDRDVVSYNSMIVGYVKCGAVERARELFDGMEERNLITWNSMIGGRDVNSCNSMMAGYVQNGCCIEALKIFYDMKRSTNVVPDDTTLLIVITAFAQLGHVEDGVVVRHYIMEKGYSLNGKLGVALIDMYSKCGSIENAISVFENVEQKCVDHWSAMIGGLDIHGMDEMTFEFLMEMGRISVIPDDITFIGVLSACRHAGMLKEGLICFELMQKAYKLEP